MPWRFLGKCTNSNIHRAVTDGPFSVEICQGCTFNPKKEIPYDLSMVWFGRKEFGRD